MFARVLVFLRLRRLHFARAALRWAPTEAQRVYLLTLTIGVVCGLTAVAFHLAIQFAQRALIDRALHAPGHAWIALTLLTPTVGAIVCGLALHYVVPNARGSGIPQVKSAFAQRDNRIRLRDAVGKFLVSTLQLGSGSSLGREGPTVYICAGVTGLLGRVFRVSPQTQRKLLPVGAAAAIAAAFNAPIAAVTFTIEEVVGTLNQTVLSGVIIAAALAAVIEHSVLGEHPVFSVPSTYHMEHASSLMVYAVLGVAAGLLAVAFTDALLVLRVRFRASRVPRWLQPGIGGAITGALAVLVMATLGVSGVTGAGYDTLGDALAGRLTLTVGLVLCAVKLVSTACSYSSGGAGGIFAPSLFLGAMLGTAAGALDRAVLHHTTSSGAFALVGMGAAFSGIIRAPITSILIIAEMTGNYQLMLPLMIANMTAYGLARKLRPRPLYEALLEQDGVWLDHHDLRDTLEQVRVERIAERDTSVSFREGTPAVEVVAKSNAFPARDLFVVTDGDGALRGMIWTSDIREIADEPDVLPIVTASDLMRPVAAIALEDDVHAALDLMLKHGVRQVPVVDASGRWVGYVHETAVARAYLQTHRAHEAGAAS